MSDLKQEIRASRIIIENRTELDDFRAVMLVAHVIAGGRVSNNGKQYCYYTTFAGRAKYYRSKDNKKHGVYTHLNKASDRFVVIDA